MCVECREESPTPYQIKAEDKKLKRIIAAKNKPWRWRRDDDGDWMLLINGVLDSGVRVYETEDGTWDVHSNEPFFSVIDLDNASTAKKCAEALARVLAGATFPGDTKP